MSPAVITDQRRLAAPAMITLATPVSWLPARLQSGSHLTADKQPGSGQVDSLLPERRPRSRQGSEESATLALVRREEIRARPVGALAGPVLALQSVPAPQYEG